MSAWSDFWFDGFEWFMENLVLPLLFVGVLFAVVFGTVWGIVEWRNSDPLTSGTVVSKNYQPPYTSMISTGKTVTPIYHPECWNVRIEGVTAKKTLKSRSMCLPQSQYDALSIGETLKVD